MDSVFRASTFRAADQPGTASHDWTKRIAGRQFRWFMMDEGNSDLPLQEIRMQAHHRNR
jgi:hypothetical protein